MNNLKQLKQELEETKNKCAEIEKKIEKLEKQEIEARWRAKEGGNFYFSTGYGEIRTDCDGHHKLDTDRYSLGNYFETKKEAEKAVEKIKIYTQLRDVALKLNHDEEIDWENTTQTKYYICYDNSLKKLYSDCVWTRRELGQIYCLSIKFLNMALLEIGEENLRKLFE